MLNKMKVSDLLKSRKQVLVAVGVFVLVIAAGIILVVFGTGSRKVNRSILTLQSGDSQYPAGKEELQDTLSLGVGTLTGQYLPGQALVEGDLAVSGVLYEPLIAPDRSGFPVARLCKKYTVSKDGKEYRFEIPQGILYSDGTPLEMDDIAAAVSAQNPELFLEEDAVEIDGNTVVFRFVHADADNIWKFGCGIYKPSDMDPALSPGTGPYRLSAEQGPEEAVLIRNEYYRGKPAKTETVRFVETNAAALYESLATGEVDLASFSYQPIGVEGALENSFVDVYSFPGNRTGYLGLNLENELFSMQDIRLAVAYAIDYDRILALYSGHARVNASPFQMVSWQTPGGMEPYRQDKAKAEELLKKAGFTRGDDGLMELHGEVLQLRMVTYSGTHASNVCEIVKENLKEIGIACELVQVRFDEMQDLLFTSQGYDLYYANWQYGLADSPGRRFGEPDSLINPEGWYPLELEELLNQLQGEANPARQKNLYHKIAQLYHKQLPQIPLDSPDSFVAASSSVRGLKLSPFLPPYWNLEELSLEK